MKRCNGNVSEVHCDLGSVVFFNEPAESLAVLQAAFLLDLFPVFISGEFPLIRSLCSSGITDVQSDLFGQGGVGGVKVYIVGYEKIPRTNGADPCFCCCVIPFIRTEIRLPFSFSQLVLKRFVLALTNIGQFDPLRF